MTSRTSRRRTFTPPFVSQPLRYAIAVALPFACTAVQLSLTPAILNTPFVTYFLAVLVSVWVGGLGPGLVTTVLSAALGTYAFMPSTNAFGTAMFVIVAALIALVASTARRQLIERARLLDEMAAAKAAAEEASRAKDQVLAMLGHELRNPLTPMLSAIELMRRRGDVATAREREILERQVRHMARLVDDLLDVSRLLTGKLPLSLESVALDGVVADAVEALGPISAQRQHTITVSLGDEPLAVLADPARLHQVLSNLLLNAAKFTDPGGRIEVSARAPSSSLVELVVRDTGRGIAPELLPRVFDAFVQGPQGIDRADGGLGLGLAIVRLLVEQQGGTVTASSDGVGKGSAFTVTMARAELAVAPSKRVTGERASVAAPVSRVLVIDDNTDAADLLVEALGLAGHEARAVYDGNSALAVDDPFDVAIVDIGLPDVDGFALARQLRERHRDRPLRLVALTGYGDSGTRGNARKAGFDHFLVKPVMVESVLAAVAAPPDVSR